MIENRSKWPKFPLIYQINTWPWLQSLSKINDFPVNLQNIPEGLIDMELSHFNAIWLMGVWERSPKGREIAVKHPDLQQEYRNALVDFKPEDVVGSPYAIHDYLVDYHIGGRDGLAHIREQLSELGIKLILDYVPNHTAMDHLWTSDNAKIYIEGSEKELENLPNDYFFTGRNIIAHGRDPNYYPWTDTAQIDAFSPDARKRTIETLLTIADQCDGVRCDMAMLLTNNVFNHTWDHKVQAIPKTEFWREIIPAVKEKHPNFIFIGEVYWDMEWELQQQGFDFCYDKKLYERMANENAQTVRAHLNADWEYQSKLVRFIENHDEPRALSVFGLERSQAAAILALTLPGARLVHEGQMSGLKIKLPVQLGRRQTEEYNQELMEFYLRLLNAVPSKELGELKWSLCKVESVNPSNFSYTNLISYLWSSEKQNHLIVVNFSPYAAQGHVRININYGIEDWTFTDLLAQKSYSYNGEDLNKYGLYIDLPAWSGHIFNIIKVNLEI